MNDFREMLCDNNKKLLSEIEEKLPIVFECWNNSYWGAKYFNYKTLGKIYHPNEFSDAKVAHELLHFKISLIMGNNSILVIKAKLKDSHVVNFIRDEMVEDFLNHYEHMMLYNEYKAMGFDDDDFFDKDSFIETEREMKQFTDSIKKGGLSFKNEYAYNTLYPYISATIACLSYPLVKDKWKKELKILEKSDKALFSILKRYWTEVLSIPLSEEGKVKLFRVHEIFIDNLSKWFNNKTIVYPERNN